MRGIIFYTPGGFVFLIHLLFFCSVMIRPCPGQVAQEIGFSGSPNPVGSGARALGMGGAFIGVADDATAASWNPGGLIQLETPEVSMVFSHENRSEKRQFRQTPGASGTHSLDLTDMSYLSAAFPFTLYGMNMIASLNYQTLYDFNKGVETHYASNQPFPGPMGSRITNKRIKGYLKALSPACAIQITPAFSAGAAINLFSSKLGSKWETTYQDDLVGTFAGLPYFRNVLYRDQYEFDGVNFTLGVLWNLTPSFTLGAVLKTPFDADIHYREIYQVSGTTQNKPATVLSDEDQTMRMPSSYGIGAALRFSDRFSMGFDLFRTDWQDYYLEQANGTKISLFTGQAISTANTRPTYQARMGSEFLLIHDNYIIPVRAGLFYDPEPTTSSPDTFFGFSLGTGIGYNRFVFDIAYQYRWGNDVRAVRLSSQVVEQDIQQHILSASIIYHF